jgi:hypothetical protein
MSAFTRRRPSRETPEPELEMAANRLLWGGGRPRDLEYSFHTDQSLQRTGRLDLVRAEAPPPVLHPMGRGEDELGYLLEALLAEACLAQRHRQVLSLVRHGLSHQRIAEAMGVKLQTARRWHQQALAELRRYCTRQTEGETARNLEEAYRDQLRPGLHHREEHCLPGREACREDGLCKFRWYLHREADQEW